MSPAGHPIKVGKVKVFVNQLDWDDPNSASVRIVLMKRGVGLVDTAVHVLEIRGNSRAETHLVSHKGLQSTYQRHMGRRTGLRSTVECYGYGNTVETLAEILRHSLSTGWYPTYIRNAPYWAKKLITTYGAYSECMIFDEDPSKRPPKTERDSLEPMLDPPEEPPKPALPNRASLLEF